jgi:hypothetical protein
MWLIKGVFNVACINVACVWLEKGGFNVQRVHSPFRSMV